MKLYSIKDIMEMFDVSYNAVMGWISSGKLNGFRVGRLWRFSEQNIKDFLDKCNLIQEAEDYEITEDGIKEIKKEDK